MAGKGFPQEGTSPVLSLTHFVGPLSEFYKLLCCCPVGSNFLFHIVVERTRVAGIACNLSSPSLSLLLFIERSLLFSPIRLRSTPRSCLRFVERNLTPIQLLSSYAALKADVSRVLIPSELSHRG